jgi:ribulose-bisphosphate carboxylase large chain
MIFRDELDSDKYIIVKYFLESQTNLKNAAWNLAIGQSVGNPNVRNRWEDDTLFENHSCIIKGDEKQLEGVKSGIIEIGFPLINLDWNTDGISQFLCFILGGQLDIDDIISCHALDITFPSSLENKFKKPKYGLSGFRAYTGIYEKPIFGGIIKPKTGISSDTLLNMVKEMVDGGVNFIKEDEILSNPGFCTIEERVPKIMRYLEGKKVIYAVCINSDPAYILERTRRVYELGGNGIHVNFWAGLGVYKSIRDMNLPLFLHVQKSGSRILTHTSHNYRMSWYVFCKLCAIMGIDSIHAGMLGGYSTDDELELNNVLELLRKYDVTPVLSCGMHPGLIQFINDKIGVDYMANVGGALHGHPGGTYSGCRAMRQAIDGVSGIEYKQAIEKWGKK